MALFINGTEVLIHGLEAINIEEMYLDGNKVARKPMITTQPVGGTIIEDETLTLSVVADGLGSTLSYQWYNGSAPISGATGTSYVFTPSSTGNHTFFCRVTGFGGYTDTDTVTVVVEERLPDLISETAFNESGTITLASDCIRIEAQGCGGGGGGGGSEGIVLFIADGAGGGGAAMQSVQTSSATGGSLVNVAIGQGGEGGLFEQMDPPTEEDNFNGLDGQSTILSGDGITTLTWLGGFGGLFGYPEDDGGLDEGQSAGGNDSTGSGGGAINTDGTGGGGGGGGRESSNGSTAGGKGGGVNGGIAGGNAVLPSKLPITKDAPRELTNYGGQGGGGGANDATWWDSADSGKGGDGGMNAQGGTAYVGASATGFGNGGGGAAGGQVWSWGGNGANGRLILRQYRR
ncbi:glycine-rich domain-containing protein [Vibrio parahaemolyticus]|uniref:glycine-rich domain-containing protein n=1 Tax=Vibrio parahaemolyticus TaxID=670 RepID=UPI000467B8F0|nr:hypothetical protein [Vibrio parahaemolyticus]